MKRKVLLCGTHPKQFNGYSKVVFELANEIAKYDDIELTIFAFQNFYSEDDHTKERLLPDNVRIFDAFAREEKGGKGFGEKLIKDFVEELCPDIVIIYNDVIIVSLLLKQLAPIREKLKFKLVPYIDLVYQNEKKSYIDFIHKESDAIIAFTDYWKEELQRQEYNKPIHVLKHAFNKDNYFPIPKHVARKYFDISQEDFIILNLNRNQPRKRWDLCIQAYVKFISRHRDEKIKLLVMTNVIGSWDLIQLMKFEGARYGMDVGELRNFFTFIQSPQKISDAEVNVMYSVADVGWNTCDGEGFGLCNFEQAGVGKAQIIPNVGGFKDFFTKDNALIVEPSIGIYGDTSKDACGGFQELCTVDSYVEALETYYSNRDLLEKHGKQARADVLKYRWHEQAGVLRDIIMEETSDMYPEESSTEDLMASINDMLEAADAKERDSKRGDARDARDDGARDNAREDASYTQESVANKISLNGDDNIDIDKLIDEKLKERQKLAERHADATKLSTDVNVAPTDAAKPQQAKNNNTADELESLSPNDLVAMQQRIQNILNRKNQLRVS